MVVKEAVAAAKQAVIDAFAGEHVSNLGLEEVEFLELGPAHGVWNVTIGFSRPWDRPPQPDTGLAIATAIALARSGGWSRSYKVVRIADPEGRVLSIKDRQIEKA